MFLPLSVFFLLIILILVILDFSLTMIGLLFALSALPSRWAISMSPSYISRSGISALRVCTTAVAVSSIVSFSFSLTPDISMLFRVLYCSRSLIFPSKLCFLISRSLCNWTYSCFVFSVVSFKLSISLLSLSFSYVFIFQKEILLVFLFFQLPI